MYPECLSRVCVVQYVLVLDVRGLVEFHNGKPTIARRPLQGKTSQ
jgi:tRNA 2-selenouridine synthase SelU